MLLQKKTIFHYITVGLDPQSDKLRFVELPLLPPSKCFTPSKLYLCAAGLTLGEKGTCHGDSGGPLVVPRSIFSDYTAIVIGVASFVTKSAPDGDCDRLSVFNPVIPQLKWIKSNMG